MVMQTASLGAPAGLPNQKPATAPPSALRALVSWTGAGILCAFALLASATPALAQNQQPNQGQGFDANPPQQRLEPTGETFGDWRLICTVQAEGAAAAPPQACFISERVVDPASQQAVLVVTIGYFRSGSQPGALFSMPLGIPLSTGVQISVDGRPVSTIPFEVCRRDGCQAFVQLDETVVNAFKAGSQGSVTVRTGERGVFNVPFSLSGFTAGYGRIK